MEELWWRMNCKLSQLLKDFSAIEGRKVLVHGGGRRATQVAAKLGIETKMVGGRRITDAAMLEVVTMVYGGLVNKNLVAQLQANGVNALGLTGTDANVIRSHKRLSRMVWTMAMWVMWIASHTRHWDA